jgi:hypothetical protein
VLYESEKEKGELYLSYQAAKSLLERNAGVRRAGGVAEGPALRVNDYRLEGFALW